ncbi:MAG TPA: peptidoglycan-binding protein [Thermoanaerobaculia bacterium]|nr:peptidoglycan-binding protein [Thermoanaerobaculia bacterium]
MSYPTLRRGSRDAAHVELLQHALNEAGQSFKADGSFGPRTEEAVRAFQTMNGLPVTGVAGPETWKALSRISRYARPVDTTETLPGFRGDLDWIHRFEGHRGTAYWPGGASGVTLDPGLDLGHAAPDLIRKVITPLLSDEQLAALNRVLGIRGEAARDALRGQPLLSTIRIDLQTARELFPHIAKPFWRGTTTRFPNLASASAPPQAHTAMLSLSYNRGYQNPHLNVLAKPIESADWRRLGELIGSMQQDHKLPGIRDRRRAEGDLILSALG